MRIEVISRVDGNHHVVFIVNDNDSHFTTEDGLVNRFRLTFAQADELYRALKQFRREHPRRLLGRRCVGCGAGISDGAEYCFEHRPTRGTKPAEAEREQP